MIEYVCVDCGCHVFAVGRNKPPDPERCAVCAWAWEFVADPDARAAMIERQRRETGPE